MSKLNQVIADNWGCLAILAGATVVAGLVGWLFGLVLRT